MTTVLYVDDEIINLTVFAISFRKKYHVITTDSAEKALDILNNNKEIKVVISDMKMPFMDGLTFIRTAKPSFANLTFFILTGFEKTPEIEAAIQEGLIVAYFKKPFNMQKIEEAISQVINS